MTITITTDDKTIAANALTDFNNIVEQGAETAPGTGDVVNKDDVFHRLNMDPPKLLTLAPFPDPGTPDPNPTPITVVSKQVADNGMLAIFLAVIRNIIPDATDKIGNQVYTGPFLTTGQTVTESLQALSDAIGGGTTPDFLLDNEPVAVATTYTTTFTGGLVTNETWVKTAGGALIKTVDYSYTGSSLTTEVRKVYDPTGVTITAQVTITYSYSGSQITGYVLTRDV